MKTIPLIAYNASARKHVGQLYKRGGVTMLDVRTTDTRFRTLSETGAELFSQKMHPRSWVVRTRLRVPITADDQGVAVGVRPWRLLAAQEPQMALHAEDWTTVLATLDNYDLNRNPNWPYKPGAVWMPRGHGCSWAHFLDAIDFMLNGKPWPHAKSQLAPYMPVLQKYGDKLNKLLGDRK